MSNFMPVDESKAAALNAKLSSTLLESYEKFVELYNSGFINTSNPEVLSIVEEITATFKNINHEGRQLVFISKSEVLFEEAVVNLSIWSIASKIKRELSTLVEANEVSIEDTVVFSNSTRGVILVESETGELNKVGSEKHFKTPAEIAEVHAKFSSQPETDEGDYQFAVTDLLDIDDDFISKIHELIP